MKKLLITILLIFATITLLLSIRIYQFFTEKRKVNVHFKVEKGQSVRAVLNRLKQLNLIENEPLIYLWIRYKHIPMKAGCYSINGTYSVVELIQKLTEGHPCLTKVTIPEGANLFDVDKILSKNGFCKRGEVLKLSRDRAFLKQLNLRFLEGYVFPDTYYVRESASCSEVLKESVKNFKTRTALLFKTYKPPELVKTGLSRVTADKILTVASIVEKETSQPEEKPTIAGVIYNRLKRDMNLQCDSTVFYAYRTAGIEKKTLHKGDTLFPSPYNTYYRKGLPPTPICNPGLGSIRAAMYPAKTPYLYFVADNGRLIFSKSYNQHLNLIRKIYRNEKEKN